MEEKKSTSTVVPEATHELLRRTKRKLVEAIEAELTTGAAAPHAIKELRETLKYLCDLEPGAKF